MAVLVVQEDTVLMKVLKIRLGVYHVIKANLALRLAQMHPLVVMNARLADITHPEVEIVVLRA